MQIHNCTLFQRMRYVFNYSDTIVLESVLGIATLMYGLLMPSITQNVLDTLFNDSVLMIIRFTFVLCGLFIISSCLNIKMRETKKYLVLLVVQSFLWYFALINVFSYSVFGGNPVDINYFDGLIFLLLCGCATYVELRKVL